VKDGKIDTTLLIYSHEADMGPITVRILVCIKSQTNSPISLLWL